jgi:hypothetical protein
MRCVTNVHTLFPNLKDRRNGVQMVDTFEGKILHGTLGSFGESVRRPTDGAPPKGNIHFLLEGVPKTDERYSELVEQLTALASEITAKKDGQSTRSAVAANDQISVSVAGLPHDEIIELKKRALECIRAFQSKARSLK